MVRQLTVDFNRVAEGSLRPSDIHAEFNRVPVLPRGSRASGELAWFCSPVCSGLATSGVRDNGSSVLLRMSARMSTERKSGPAGSVNSSTTWNPQCW